METIGERRVRVDFNISGNDKVSEIKKGTAALINISEDLSVDHTNMLLEDPELFRLIERATIAYEEAAMWAVKAATFKQYEVKNNDK